MIADRAFDKLMEKLSGWFDSFVLLVPNLALAIIVLVVFWIAARILSRLLVHVLFRVVKSYQISSLIGTTFFIALVVAGCVLALGLLGLDKTVTSLLAGAGIIGLALGLAFQSMGANFISGIYLAVRRPFRIGHLIESKANSSKNIFGTVERLTLLMTEILTPEGQRVFIPNKAVVENPIINFSVTGRRRVDVKVGVAYASDLGKVKEVATEAAEGVKPRYPDTEVELFFEEFGASGINLVVRFWIPFAKQSDYLKARAEAIQRIMKNFDDNGIVIPFPVLTLNLPSGKEHELSAVLPEAASAKATPE